jgi:hypothetical protein
MIFKGRERAEEKGSQPNAESLDALSGVPKGIRTPVAGVKGLRCHPKNVE